MQCYAFVMQTGLRRVASLRLVWLPHVVLEEKRMKRDMEIQTVALQRVAPEMTIMPVIGFWFGYFCAVDYDVRMPG